VDTVDGVALSKAELEERARTEALSGTSTIEVALHQRKGRSFFLALGLRFGQAGNSGLIQTFLVGYLATALAVSKSVGTDAILIGSLFGFLTVPIVGLLGDRFGRRPLYIAFAIMAMLWAFPMLLMITSADPTLITIGMAVGLNICVLGLFSLESVTLPELFGARTRFTQLALAKEIGGILATAIGPVLAATLVAVTGQWWPLAAMVVGYSAITLVSAIIAPEVRGRDLVRLEDAA
jgi:MHS family metabolite:H+ symporter-like MFS transporter